jgi:(2Fe-2S) ferredoxin
VKELGLNGAGQIRVNKAGCLDHCASGPVMVIYPQGTWYSMIDNEDVEEIIQSHLVQGKPVERLLI